MLKPYANDVLRAGARISLKESYSDTTARKLQPTTHRQWQQKQKYNKERNPNAQPPTKTTWNSGWLGRIRDIPSLLVKNNKTTDRTTRGHPR